MSGFLGRTTVGMNKSYLLVSSPGSSSSCSKQLLPVEFGVEKQWSVVSTHPSGGFEHLLVERVTTELTFDDGERVAGGHDARDGTTSVKLLRVTRHFLERSVRSRNNTPQVEPVLRQRASLREMTSS